MAKGNYSSTVNLHGKNGLHQAVNISIILTEMTGLVSRPQAKNSRKMTTRAWYVLA